MTPTPPTHALSFSFSLWDDDRDGILTKSELRKVPPSFLPHFHGFSSPAKKNSITAPAPCHMLC